MNKFFVLAIVFLACSIMNLLNVYLTGNGISLVLGVAWLVASACVFIQYRKMKNQDSEEDRS